ncbi:membrane protein, partial [mine drainage metagenome]
TLTLLVLAVGAGLTVAFADVTHRVVLFDGSYVADPLAFVLKLAGFLSVAVALLYSRAYLRNREILKGEYYVLALTALLGIVRAHLGQQPAHGVSGRGAAGAVGVCDGGL